MKFKVFFSWQSDFAQNTGFIRKCIDDAIAVVSETETVEAIRDEATKDTTGAPNIVTTLFSKIDECDMFIADVTTCYECNISDNKVSPNPNVLLELGYAVKTIGWERIICLCNEDAGRNLPFDYSHNRVTFFTVHKKELPKEKERISGIILKNILAIKEKGPRISLHKTMHIVGTYDYAQRKVRDCASSIILAADEKYINKTQVLKDKCKEIITRLEKIIAEVDCEISEEESASKENSIFPESIMKQLDANSFYQKYGTLAEWGKKDIDRVRGLRLLDIKIPERCFIFHRLYKMPSMAIGGEKWSIEGNDKEKVQYQLLRLLSRELSCLEARVSFPETFNFLAYIPIAIQNISVNTDSDVHITIWPHDCELIKPQKTLLSPKCQGLEYLLCTDEEETHEEGLISELFRLKEDGMIHISSGQEVVNTSRTPRRTLDGICYEKKGDDDYGKELCNYIATPAEGEYYEFCIESIRPNECLWIQPGILIHSDSDEITMDYAITSNCSDGSIRGAMKVYINKYQQ